MDDLPVSLRTAETEKAYQEAKANGKTTPIELLQSLKTFDHWRIVNNDYTYNIGYKRCHMLVVKRAGVADWDDLNTKEVAEYYMIRRSYLLKEYDQIIENSPSRRSIAHLYHKHLVNFHDHRRDMSL